MRIIRPTVVTPSMLTACNVAETEYPTWAGGTTYAAGDRVIYLHVIYESLAGSNYNYTPSTQPTKWLSLGATNQWKMFDSVVGSRTVNADSITLTVAPGLIDSIAFLDLVAVEINVVMTDPTEGIVYTETIDLVDESVVIDAYTYFFEPIVAKDATVLLGLPAYPNATISIELVNTGLDVEVGTIAFGLQKLLGSTLHSSTIGITDYSKKQVDEFGNYSVLQRAFSKKMSCDLLLGSSSVDEITKLLASYRTTMLIWVGADRGYSSLIIYGFYKSFQVIIEYPKYSKCSLEVEGLT